MGPQGTLSNSAKALPTVKQLMVPVFRFFAQHDSVTSEQCADAVADHFRLSQVQRTDFGKGHEPRFNKRIEFAFNILSSTEAGLIEKIDVEGSRKRYQLTPKGHDLATEDEDSLRSILKDIYDDYYPRAFSGQVDV